MIRRIWRALNAHSRNRLNHPNPAVRRFARLTYVMLAAAGGLRSLLLDSPHVKHDSIVRLTQPLASSHSIRTYVLDAGLLRPLVGRAVRVGLLLSTAAAKAHEILAWDYRTFVLRVSGPIDQTVLRNLLLWQNYVLNFYPGLSDGRPVDVIFLIDGAADQPRYFDLFSAALMLVRVRNVTVVDGTRAIDEAGLLLQSRQDKARWTAARESDDLCRLPAAVGEHVGRHGTPCGLKLLSGGRKRANDFFKMALPGKVVIAVGLRESGDGTVETQDLDRWLPLLEAAHLRHPDVGFAILNRHAPSQERHWPACVRFVRHAGMSLQDAICVAMVADGYAGVLDLFGLAAFSAERPGVYLPLSAIEAGSEDIAVDASGRLLLGNCGVTRLEPVIEKLVAALSGPASLVRPVWLRPRTSLTGIKKAPAPGT